MTKPKTKTVNDLSRCLDPLDMDATLIAVVEMSQSSWLVGGIVPGVGRQPLGPDARAEQHRRELLQPAQHKRVFAVGQLLLRPRLLRHLEEQEEGEFGDVLMIGDAVILEHVAKIP